VVVEESSMAIFTLTPGTDNFPGLAGDDNFFDFTSADLQSTDTITGGATGSFIETLRITAAGTIVAGRRGPSIGRSGIHMQIVS
jgi:hypothetical protein